MNEAHGPRAGETARVPQIAGETARVPQVAGETAHVPRIAGETARVPRIAGETASVPRIAGATASVPQIAGETANLPCMLWIVRHGQSAGNVARDAAEAAGHARIDIAERDIDVPLSPLGERQAASLGRWFAGLAADERPERVLVSPYVRAQATAAAVVRALGEVGTPPRLHTDERLREKEFGILDRLTRVGIIEKHPEISAQMSHVGKFYFRPPGGESWCDVILRLRGVLDTLALEFAGERLLIVAHQVTVNCLRYLVERMDEAQILGIDRQGDVPNCSVTSYALDPSLGKGGGLALRLVNFVAPLQQEGTPVTHEPDAPVAPAS